MNMHMKIFKISLLKHLLFLLIIFTPAGALAQQSSAGSGASTDSGFTVNEFSASVENVATQSSSGGTFIGSNNLDGFVGIDVLVGNDRSSSNRSSVAAARTSTPRRTQTTTAARRPGSTMMGGIGSSANNQSIRSIIVLDDDLFPSPQKITLPTAGTTLGTPLTKVPGLQQVKTTITSSPLGTTAVLTGSVATEKARRIAQQMLLLEPGIHRVENLLEVQ